MLVPIRGPDGELQEWAMVELQGKFESTSGEDTPIDEIGIIQVSPLVSRGIRVRSGSRRALELAQLRSHACTTGACMHARHRTRTSCS